MATVPSSDIHSTHNSSESVNSTRSRSSATGGGSSPWTQIVRGGESESIMSSASPSSPSSLPGFQEQATQVSSDWTSVEVPSSFSPCPEDSATDAQQDGSDYSNENNNAGKKPAWSRPSNGAKEVGPVMGASSWPPLPESTSSRGSPKSLSTESLKTLSDGNISTSQGTGIDSSLAQKQDINNFVNPNPTPNHVTPTRQKSMRRGGGSASGNVTVNGSSHQPLPVSTASSVVETPSNNAGKPGSVVPESSSGGHTHKETGQRGNLGSQSHSGNDHGHQRNSFRRGNGGHHPRGDGSYHHNHWGRRDQDRANHDWNSNRSYNGREPHMHQQRAVHRGFIRPYPPGPPALSLPLPPHSSTPFIPSPMPVRPFGGPMVYPDMPTQLIYVSGLPPESFGAVPMLAPMPPMFYPFPDMQLHSKIVKQIEYYFSNENLIKDTYLRQNMDNHGWVPIKLIASFRKVTELTENSQLILDVVRTSTIVEVQGDKIRRRNDWAKWIMPPVQFSGFSSPRPSARSSQEMLTASMQNVSLQENTTHNHGETFSGDINGQSKPSSSEGTSQAHVEEGSELPTT